MLPALTSDSPQSTSHLPCASPSPATISALVCRQRLKGDVTTSSMFSALIAAAASRAWEFWRSQEVLAGRGFWQWRLSGMLGAVGVAFGEKLGLR